jgi:flagellin
MTLSVANNPSALLALQTLNRTTDQLTQVQDQISTGHAVDRPQDNPTIWAMAQGQSSQIDGLNAVTSSLNRATSISDVALSAGQSVLDLLGQLKSHALSAQDAQLSASDRGALNTDFGGLLQRITIALGSAAFDGSNLLDGSQASNMRFLATSDGSQTVTLPTANLSLGGAVITLSAGSSISTPATASAMMALIDASIGNVTSAMTNIGDQAKLITSHAQLVANLSQVLQNGVTDLIGNDNAADSARLKALQVQQQIGQQSLSIANSAPQLLLHLFK